MARAWTKEQTAALLRVPGADDDKRSRGVVALRTGSEEYPGAAVLGVEAAWRTGAGFVRYLGPAAGAVLARRPETVVSGHGPVRADVWVIGSGTDPAHRSTDEERALHELLVGDVPVVVDAGALDLVAGANAPVIATPHAGEFVRLRDSLGLPESAEVTAVADALGATILLKGSRTLVAAPGEGIIALPQSTAWLATAGTGDVLAGILGALIAANPGWPLNEVGAAAANLHDLAARIASGARDGAVGHPIVALDVAEALPAAVGELLG